jgi:hypothetical protein
MTNWLAISVIQPWAWLLVRPDVTDPAGRMELRARGWIKDVENRDWYSNTRGWVLLHASATKLARWDWQAAAMFALARGVDVPAREAVDRGAFVGAIRIDGCEGHVRSRWFTGKHGFLIGDAVPFRQPVPAKGELKFFAVTDQDLVWRINGEIVAAGRGDILFNREGREGRE